MSVKGGEKPDRLESRLDRCARRFGSRQQRRRRDPGHRIRPDQRHGVPLRAARGEQRRRGPGGERHGHARGHRHRARRAGEPDRAGGRCAGDADLDAAGPRRRRAHREIPVPPFGRQHGRIARALDGRARRRLGRQPRRRALGDGPGPRQRQAIRLRGARGEPGGQRQGGEGRGHPRARTAAPRVRFPGQQFRADRGPRRADLRHA